MKKKFAVMYTLKVHKLISLSLKICLMLTNLTALSTVPVQCFFSATFLHFVTSYYQLFQSVAGLLRLKCH